MPDGLGDGDAAGLLCLTGLLAPSTASASASAVRRPFSATPESLVSSALASAAAIEAALRASAVKISELRRPSASCSTR